MGHVTLVRQIKKVCVTVRVLPCFILYLKAVSKCKPPRAYIRRGDSTEGFFMFRVRGRAYIWRGIYTDELIFGILR